MENQKIIKQLDLIEEFVRIRLTRFVSDNKSDTLLKKIDFSIARQIYSISQEEFSKGKDLPIIRSDSLMQKVRENTEEYIKRNLVHHNDEIKVNNKKINTYYESSTKSIGEEFFTPLWGLLLEDNSSLVNYLNANGIDEIYIPFKLTSKGLEHLTETEKFRPNQRSWTLLPTPINKLPLYYKLANSKYIPPDELMKNFISLKDESSSLAAEQNIDKESKTDTPQKITYMKKHINTYLKSYIASAIFQIFAGLYLALLPAMIIKAGGFHQLIAFVMLWMSLEFYLLRLISPFIICFFSLSSIAPVYLGGNKGVVLTKILIPKHINFIIQIPILPHIKFKLNIPTANCMECGNKLILRSESIWKPWNQVGQCSIGKHLHRYSFDPTKYKGIRI
jgi:hypothetical protein